MREVRNPEITRHSREHEAAEVSAPHFVAVSKEILDEYQQDERLVVKVFVGDAQAGEDLAVLRARLQKEVTQEKLRALVPEGGDAPKSTRREEAIAAIGAFSGAGKAVVSGLKTAGRWFGLFGVEARDADAVEPKLPLEPVVDVGLQQVCPIPEECPAPPVFHPPVLNMSRVETLIGSAAVPVPMAPVPVKQFIKDVYETVAERKGHTTAIFNTPQWRNTTNTAVLDYVAERFPTIDMKQSRDLIAGDVTSLIASDDATALAMLEGRAPVDDGYILSYFTKLEDTLPANSARRFALFTYLNNTVGLDLGPTPNMTSYPFDKTLDALAESRIATSATSVGPDEAFAAAALKAVIAIRTRRTQLGDPERFQKSRDLQRDLWKDYYDQEERKEKQRKIEAADPLKGWVGQGPTPVAQYLGLGLRLAAFGDWLGGKYIDQGVVKLKKRWKVLRELDFALYEGGGRIRWTDLVVQAEILGRAWERYGWVRASAETAVNVVSIGAYNLLLEFLNERARSYAEFTPDETNTSWSARLHKSGALVAMARIAGLGLATVLTKTVVYRPTLPGPAILNAAMLVLRGLGGGWAIDAVASWGGTVSWIVSLFGADFNLASINLFSWFQDLTINAFSNGAHSILLWAMGVILAGLAVHVFIWFIDGRGYRRSAKFMDLLAKYLAPHLFVFDSFNLAALLYGETLTKRDRLPGPL